MLQLQFLTTMLRLQLLTNIESFTIQYKFVGTVSLEHAGNGCKSMTDSLHLTVSNPYESIANGNDCRIFS